MRSLRNTFLAALSISSGITLMAGSIEFWDQKDPQDWTPEQVQEMLTRSPWARPASVSFFNNGSGGFGSDFGGGIGGAGLGNRSNRRAANSGAPSESAKDARTFNATVRWASALPVRKALKSRTDDLEPGFYVLALIGDIPDFARPNNEESADVRRQRAEMLRESTKLERKGAPPIYLDHIEGGPTGTLFYFSRLEPITPSNKEITFTTKMGPLEMKAKFSLKEMIYKGRLEL